MSHYIGRVGPKIKSPFRKWLWEISGFNKYGLLHDDCLYEHPDVAEAVHRLPQKIKDERNFRIERAIHASMLHEYLPKDQWTKYEEDVRYLEPYIEDVRREHQEKFDYENNK